MAAQRHPGLAPAATAAGAAVVAAMLLHAASLAVHAPDGSAELLWMLGWAAMVTAALALVATVVQLIAERRDVGRATIVPALALIAVAVVMGGWAAWLYPPVGAGGAAALGG